MASVKTGEVRDLSPDSTSGSKLGADIASSFRSLLVHLLLLDLLPSFAPPLCCGRRANFCSTVNIKIPNDPAYGYISGDQLSSFRFHHPPSGLT